MAWWAVRTGMDEIMLVISRVAPGKPELHHCSDMPDEERLRLHGRGTHTPIDALTAATGAAAVAVTACFSASRAFEEVCGFFTTLDSLVEVTVSLLSALSIFGRS